jgi:hypothetical protein
VSVSDDFLTSVTFLYTLKAAMLLVLLILELLYSFNLENICRSYGMAYEKWHNDSGGAAWAARRSSHVPFLFLPGKNVKMTFDTTTPVRHGMEVRRLAKQSHSRSHKHQTSREP